MSIASRNIRTLLGRNCGYVIVDDSSSRCNKPESMLHCIHVLDMEETYIFQQQSVGASSSSSVSSSSVHAVWFWTFHVYNSEESEPSRVFGNETCIGGHILPAVRLKDLASFATTCLSASPRVSIVVPTRADAAMSGDIYSLARSTAEAARLVLLSFLLTVYGCDLPFQAQFTTLSVSRHSGRQLTSRA